MLHDQAILHSNMQLRTEKDGDIEKRCQKPALEQKTTDDDDVLFLYMWLKKSLNTEQFYL